MQKWWHVHLGAAADLSQRDGRSVSERLSGGSGLGRWLLSLEVVASLSWCGSGGRSMWDWWSFSLGAVVLVVWGLSLAPHICGCGCVCFCSHLSDSMIPFHSLIFSWQCLLCFVYIYIFLDAFTSNLLKYSSSSKK